MSAVLSRKQLILVSPRFCPICPSQQNNSGTPIIWQASLFRIIRPILVGKFIAHRVNTDKFQHLTYLPFLSSTTFLVQAFIISSVDYYSNLFSVFCVCSLLPCNSIILVFFLIPVLSHFLPVQKSFCDSLSSIR
jgi:hypothetical protein